MPNLAILDTTIDNSHIIGNTPRQVLDPPLEGRSSKATVLVIDIL